MSSHQSRDTKPSDRLSQGPPKIWTEHFNKSHFLKYSHGGGPGEPYVLTGAGRCVFWRLYDPFEATPRMDRAILSPPSISKEVLGLALGRDHKM